MTDAPRPGLHWGIKTSFLEYISRMPDGRASITDGATFLEGNVAAFEPLPDAVPADASPGERTWAFRGDVRFAGHHGMLYVRIADPRVTVREGRAVLTVLDPEEPDTRPRLPLVQFTLVQQDLDADLDAWLATDVALTPEGTGLFNDVYEAGEMFEPLAIFLPTTTQAA
ncbi:hypothetical protein GCM10023350_30160 [Nocardioides endophyticus]|uniref:Htaa domain-containing protein n=1 Tax=Nocardioides endophyticus TaxID=1353775 RepID=A0ABP8Z132_9ACTN